MTIVNSETGETITTELPIGDIVIGERHRRDFGDVAALADSIRKVGLLHPIVVTVDHHLIAGHRRLKALEALGVNVVPVRVIRKVADATALLNAERDENTCRKDFTPSEAVALGKALEALEKPKAEARKGSRSDTPAGKLPAGAGRVRDVVGEAVGMSGRTYEKARDVVDATKDESEVVREAAVAAVEEMDRTGKVDPAHRKLAEAKTQEAVALASQDPTVARQLLKSKGAKAVVALSNALKDLDPHEFADVVEDRDRDRLTDWADRHIDWLTSFRSGLYPLKVVKENS